MRWTQRERIFQVDGQHPWMAHHAAVPLPDLLEDARVRVYFGPRDAEGRTRVGCLELDPAYPAQVLRLYDQPSLDLGDLGAFDDSGAMPSSLIRDGGDTYLYYIGWNQRVSVSYHVSIGLAVSTDGGHVFERVHEGPIVDRGPREPYLATAPFVLHEGGAWRMWYSSGTGWMNVGGRTEVLYLIKHASSDDGVRWTPDSAVCLPPRLANEAQTRPWVERFGGGYRMWYCYRAGVGFRTDRRRSYRIGYAESSDGLDWTRLDDEGGMQPSETGWDSEMVAYPGFYDHAGVRHMLYNGNGFGESGMGHAVLRDG